MFIESAVPQELARKAQRLRYAVKTMRSTLIVLNNTWKIKFRLSGPKKSYSYLQRKVLHLSKDALQ